MSTPAQCIEQEMTAAEVLRSNDCYGDLDVRPAIFQGLTQVHHKEMLVLLVTADKSVT